MILSSFFLLFSGSFFIVVIRFFSNKVFILQKNKIYLNKLKKNFGEKYLY
jgi:hypothetical protein